MSEHLLYWLPKSHAFIRLWFGFIGYVIEWYYSRLSRHSRQLFLSSAPISISYSKSHSLKFEEGNFFTAAPGFYMPKQYGIRLKNVYEVAKGRNSTPSSTSFLSLQVVTLVPFQSKLIDRTLLSVHEVTENYLFHETNLFHPRIFSLEKVAEWIQCENKRASGWRIEEAVQNAGILLAHESDRAHPRVSDGGGAAEERLFTRCWSTASRRVPATNDSPRRNVNQMMQEAK